jgi:hypothetical protein
MSLQENSRMQILAVCLAIIVTLFLPIHSALGQETTIIKIRPVNIYSEPYTIPAENSFLLDTTECSLEDSDSSEPVNPKIIRLRRFTLPPPGAVIQFWPCLKIDYEIACKKGIQQYLLNAETLKPTGIPNCPFTGFRSGERWEVAVGIKTPTSTIDDFRVLCSANILIQ